MALIPTSWTGLVLQAPHILKTVTLSVPETLAPTTVLVRVACIALNPSDAKMVAEGYPRNSIAGTEFAGTVVAKGAAVRGSMVIGQRVCGVSLGYNNDTSEGTGAFATYAIAESHLLLALPDDLGFEDAATLPASVLTAGMVLYQEMRLPLRAKPERDAQNERKHVLVYGGSTASGILMIQLLHYSGFSPIAICSPHNFDLARSAGAITAFDYHDSAHTTIAVRTATAHKLACAIDCISTSDSMRICYGVLGNEGGRYVALNQFAIADHSRRAVRPSWVFAMRALGKRIDWGGPYKCDESALNRDFAEQWIGEATKLVKQKVVKPLRWETVGRGGLGDVQSGLDKLRRGEVSGVKLVCPL